MIFAQRCQRQRNASKIATTQERAYIRDDGGTCSVKGSAMPRRLRLLYGLAVLLDDAIVSKAAQCLEDCDVDGPIEAQ